MGDLVSTAPSCPGRTVPMNRWALPLALVYGMLAAFLVGPFEGVAFTAWYDNLAWWIMSLGLIGVHWTLLRVPTEVESSDAAGRKSVLLAVIAASLTMGFASAALFRCVVGIAWEPLLITVLLAVPWAFHFWRQARAAAVGTKIQSMVHFLWWAGLETLLLGVLFGIWAGILRGDPEGWFGVFRIGVMVMLLATWVARYRLGLWATLRWLVCALIVAWIHIGWAGGIHFVRQVSLVRASPMEVQSASDFRPDLRLHLAAFLPERDECIIPWLLFHDVVPRMRLHLALSLAGNGEQMGYRGKQQVDFTKLSVVGDDGSRVDLVSGGEHKVLKLRSGFHEEDVTKVSGKVLTVEAEGEVETVAGEKSHFIFKQVWKTEELVEFKLGQTWARSSLRLLVWK